MSSDPLQDRKRGFLGALNDVLAYANSSISQLGKEAALTRQQVYDLRNSPSLPSVEVLRKIWDTFRGHSDTFVRAQLPEIMLRGLGITKIDDQIWRLIIENALAFNPSERDAKPELRSRCIITDQIGERYDDKLLASTIWQITSRDGGRTGTQYFYFLPDPAPDHGIMLDRVRSEHAADLKEVREATYFIRAPRGLFVARMRIDDIGFPEQEAHYSLGAPRAPLLFKMQPEHAAAVRDVFLPVVQKCPLARAAGERVIHVSSRDMELVFELHA